MTGAELLPLDELLPLPEPLLPLLELPLELPPLELLLLDPPLELAVPTGTTIELLQFELLAPTQNVLVDAGP